LKDELEVITSLNSLLIKICNLYQQIVTVQNQTIVSILKNTDDPLEMLRIANREHAHYQAKLIEVDALMHTFHSIAGGNDDLIIH